jgi:hypothetical protein
MEGLSFQSENEIDNINHVTLKQSVHLNNIVNPVITGQDTTDLGYNGQNLAVYNCEFLEVLRH